MKRSEKIRIKLNYNGSVSVLPGECLKYIDRAKKFDIKVLLLLSSSETLRGGKCAEMIAEVLNCDLQDVKDSLSFWNGTGVIDLDAEESKWPSKKEAETPKEMSSVEIPKRTKVSDVPQYTSDELNLLLEKHAGACELIDECQQILGKIFNTGEVKILMGLIDYLGLEYEYIILLMHYCAEIDKRSMRYLEKVAVSCLDDGITEPADLQAELHRREEKKSFEGKIRSLFGIGSRSFTKKEKTCITAWRESYGYGEDILTKAYEITVNATGNASIPYANAIIEKWYSENLKTLEEIEQYLDKRKAEQEEGASSFDVDDFFNAALKRSYSKEKQGD